MMSTLPRPGWPPWPRPTPLEPCPRLSDRHRRQVWLKREDLQVGPLLQAARRLQPDGPARPGAPGPAGVVCASAGNHGQGLAYACRLLDVHGVVYLPRTTPRQKRDRIARARRRAGRADRGRRHLRRRGRGGARGTRRRPGRRWCPPSTTPARSPARARSPPSSSQQLGGPPDVLVVPVGGGGLLAGSLAWLRERHPSVRVVGVEPAGAASMAAAVAAGRPVAAGGHRHLRRRRRRPAGRAR